MFQTNIVRRKYFSALSSMSTTIAAITQSSDILREACFPPVLPRSNDLQCHKLDVLITLLKRTCSCYGAFCLSLMTFILFRLWISFLTFDGLREFLTLPAGQKSTVIVLCRDRDPAFVSSLLLSIETRLSGKENGFSFFLFKGNFPLSSVPNSCWSFPGFFMFEIQHIYLHD